MTFFSNTRILRRTVFAVLLVWVSALGAASVDACLLPAHRSDSRITVDLADSARSAARVPGVVASHAESAAGHDVVARASAAPCTEASDDGSHGLVETSTVFSPADPGLVRTVVLAWTAQALMATTATTAGADAPARIGPPLRIRYSRLAL